MRNYPLSCFILLAVTLLSVLPFPEVKAVKDIPLADKWVHFLMYGGLSGVIWLEMTLNERRLRKAQEAQPTPTTTGLPSPARLLLWGCLMPALLGGALEFIQEYLTTTRSGEVLDFIADTIGACLGTALALTLRRFCR